MKKAKFKVKDKNRNRIKGNKAFRFLYATAVGRVILKLFINPGVSRVCGKFLDTGVSRHIIPRFVRKHGINLEDYKDQKFRTFNKFFTREIRSELRPISEDPKDLIAPCDGMLSAYHINDGTVLPIKQSSYTISQLLGGDPVAEDYDDGVCLVYRLGVNNYHRYCYLDNGQKGNNIYIPGKLYTVRPVALAERPVFIQNCREYTVMDTENFGKVTQVEVGATLVGKIQNHYQESSFSRGEEKGMFLYGGSTIVVLIKKDAAVIPEEFFRKTEEGIESPVFMGQKVGESNE